MNNTLLKECKKIIKQRKINAEKTASSFLDKALSNEKFKQNFTKLKEAEFENARCEVYGESLKFDLKKLQNEQTKILKELNIKSKDLKPNYTCKICNDTGIVNNKYCNCLKQVINQKLIEKSGFCRNLASFKTTKCDVFDNPEKAEKLYNTMKNWCDKDSQYQIVLLLGKTGVGKTHLMECMASKLIDKNHLVYFVSAFNMNQILLEYRTSFNNSKNDILDDLLEPDYLFIDDLGTEPLFKNVTEEGLYNIISDRLMHNKKTIISTNCNPIEIEKRYGERIFSRIVNQKTSLLFNIDNSDLRLKNI